MIRRQKLRAGLLAFVMIGALAGFLYDRNAGKQEHIVVPTELQGLGNDLQEWQLQPAHSRIWRDIGMRLDRRIGRGPDAQLKAPVTLRIDASGSLYILDWSDKAIKKFSPGGMLLQTFGGHAGQGPGEFTNPTDFDVDSTGGVWVCDPVNRNITVFGPSGNVLRTIRPGPSPLRITHVGGAGYLLMSSSPDDKLFAWYAPDDRQRVRFGEVVEHQERFGVALDGKLTGDGGGHFVYAAYRAGVIAMGDVDRRPAMLFLPTLDHRGMPRILTRESRDMREAHVDPDAGFGARDVSLDGDEVHVLSGERPAPGTSAMDVYDFHSGRYRYSYRVDGMYSAAKVRHRKFYGIADSALTILSFSGAGLPQEEDGHSPPARN
jgi:hypothetical protein